MKSMFLQQSYNDNWSDYERSLTRVRFPKWDYIILTASNESQAQAYRTQIDYRVRAGYLPANTHYAVLPDPYGKRVGSGVATLNVLRYIREREGTADCFKGKHILVIHSGGDSKRVPQYSACGKLYAPMTDIKEAVDFSLNLCDMAKGCGDTEKFKSAKRVSLCESFNNANVTEILPWAKKLEDKISAQFIMKAIDSRKTVSDAKAAQIKQYLNAHYTERITLDLLESEFFLSKYYIEKEFKRCYGITVFGYVIAKRINLAKRLLRFTDKTIEEISQMCGFSDQSYFNRQFKKTEGITGSAFRKKWRN